MQPPRPSDADPGSPGLRPSTASRSGPGAGPGGHGPDSDAAAQAAAFAERARRHARRALDRHLPAEDYRPLSRRRQLGLAVAGVLTACALFWVLAERPGKQGIDRRLLQADSQRCAPGQTQNCVGGQAQVILLPAPAVVPPAPSLAPSLAPPLASLQPASATRP